MPIRFALIAILIFLASFSFAQDSNFLQFKILSRIDNNPIMSASLRIDDSIMHRVYQNFSDSNGLVRFYISRLKSDSAFLSLRVAMDTLTHFKIYKNRMYGYEMVLYVDTDAIKRKNQVMRGKNKKVKRIKYVCPAGRDL